MRKIGLLLVIAFMVMIFAPVAQADTTIWNRYGEIIGVFENDLDDEMTDLSDSATNAVCNPDFIKTEDNDYGQRYLTATNGTEPCFVDGRNAWANELILDGFAYDIKTISGAIKKYSHEFGSPEEAQEIMFQAILEQSQNKFYM